MRHDDQRMLRILRVIIGAGILSTAIHYTHNFVAVHDYPGTHGWVATATQVAILVTWPLFTAVGIIAYRRYRDRRYREARVGLLVFSLSGLGSLGHFAFGVPKIPPFFFATIFTDGLSAVAVVLFVAWSARMLGAAPHVAHQGHP